MYHAEFVLHPQLEKDCLRIGHFDLNLVLLVNDKHYPWFILVPQRAQIQEIYQLSKTDQQLLLNESSAFAKAIQAVFNADKLNVAALGNMVPQLHLHHIVRYQTDAAWPGPIWGVKEANPYQDDDIAAIITKVKQAAITGLAVTA